MTSETKHIFVIKLYAGIDKCLGVLEGLLCILHIEHIVEPAVKVEVVGNSLVKSVLSRHTPLFIGVIIDELEVVVLPIKVNVVGKYAYNVCAGTLVRSAPRLLNPGEIVKQIFDAFLCEILKHSLLRILRYLVEEFDRCCTVRGGVNEMMSVLLEETSLGIL